MTGIHKFSWVGSSEMFLDEPTTIKLDEIVIGRYDGKASAGVNKNEDGVLVLSDPNGGWEFVMLLDAHKTAESAELLMKTMDREVSEIINCLSLPIHQAFKTLEDFLLSVFKSEAFRSQCQQVEGETACLLCVRKENYLWWFSVGDNSVYLLHPDLAGRGQYLLNQRNHYEWIGSVNTFDQPVPCYSSGVRELRQGHNLLVMTKDGSLEFGEREFENPQGLYDAFYNEESLEKCTQNALLKVHAGQGRDSATLVAWNYGNDWAMAMSSD
ncbi:protein phosphatase 2C domain-containing protein [Paenibacillus sp. NPDC056722]|uniref:protein phosphatase 2C domain-containing protein n=1 Tax=Paenibacillus sp. NPDC056722 TaxID=3345924 RepID=UPI0036BC8939